MPIALTAKLCCLFIEFKRKGTPILFSLIKHVEILLEAISVTEETFL